MLEQAKQADENIYKEVQPYMLAIFPRMTFNYLSLTLGILILWFAGIYLLDSFMPQALSTSIIFALSLLIFVFGWRFLENRNHATSLFVLYTSYSRQRRDFKAQLRGDDKIKISTSIGLLEETAQEFIAAAKDSGVEPIYEDEKKEA